MESSIMYMRTHTQTYLLCAIQIIAMRFFCSHYFTHIYFLLFRKLPSVFLLTLFYWLDQEFDLCLLCWLDLEFDLCTMKCQGHAQYVSSPSMG
uniref:Uncharacterized protein n=1 Tax=Arundo donax TaxID=35708 RepID=A0A0A9HXZ4_ARUDO